LVSEVIQRFFFEGKKPSVKMGRFNAGKQGRGRGGRGNGHTSSGGRGEGKSRLNNNKSSSTKKTENINDFFNLYNSGSNKHPIHTNLSRSSW
jgi:hypothetical protein